MAEEIHRGGGGGDARSHRDQYDTISLIQSRGVAAA
jgi:hypothetical protein